MVDEDEEVMSEVVVCEVVEDPEPGIGVNEPETASIPRFPVTQVPLFTASAASPWSLLTLSFQTPGAPKARRRLGELPEKHAAKI